MKTRTSMRSTIQRSVALRLVLGFVAVLVAVAAVQLGLTALPLPRLLSKALLLVVTMAAAVISYTMFFRWAESRSITELGRAALGREMLLGMLLGALMFVAVVAALAGLGAFRITGTNTLDVLLIPLLISGGSAVFEEVLFRGVVFRLLEEGLGSWLGLLLSALLFGGLHMLNENATVLGAASVALEAGVVLAATYMFTRRLWLAIGLHFSWNFVQSGVFGIAVSGNTPLPGLFKSALAGPEWLTGGGFGAEASVVAVVVSTIVGVIFLMAAGRRGQIIRTPWGRPRPAGLPTAKEEPAP